MKLRISLIVVLSAALLSLTAFVLPQQANAAVIIVDTRFDEFDVTGVTGTGCSLREALHAVNTGGTGDNMSNCENAETIQPFGMNDQIVLYPMTPESYELTIAGNDDTGASGDLDILKSVKIYTAFGAKTVIDGLAISNRIFDIPSLYPDQNTSTVSLTGLIIKNGYTTGTDDGFGGGGIMIEQAESVTIEDCYIIDNIAMDSAGGGLAITAPTTINNSVIGGNIATDEGGTMMGTGSGGGIFHDIPSLTISNTTISYNFADNNGGGYAQYDGSVIIEKSYLYSNQSQNGAAISGGSSIQISDTTIAHNISTGNGGGISWNGWASQVTIANSTIGHNYADGQGGAAFVGYGNSVFSFYNSTVADNTASQAGGIYIDYDEGGTFGAADEVGIRNTIVANNSNGDAYCETSGAFTSGGYNLIEDIGNCDLNSDGNTSLLGVDPNLGALQNNDGYSPTYALNAGSQAINAANPSGCLGIDGTLVKDQRGHDRHVDGRCDIGAYEVSSAQLPQVNTPWVSPHNNEGYDSLTAALEVTTDNAEIRYELFGTIPDQYSPVYSDEVTVSTAGTVIKAIAYAYGMRPSNVMSYTLGQGGFGGTGLSPIYRFWSNPLQRHFYTIDVSERDYVLSNYADTWTNYEGAVYQAFSADCGAYCYPVYRFWSDAGQAHFYTISETERDFVLANYGDHWNHYEGVVFYAYKTQADGAQPVYRFWSDSLGTHFYTISQSERDFVIANYSGTWSYEGVVFYAFE